MPKEEAMEQLTLEVKCGNVASCGKTAPVYEGAIKCQFCGAEYLTYGVNIKKLFAGEHERIKKKKQTADARRYQERVAGRYRVFVLPGISVLMFWLAKGYTFNMHFIERLQLWFTTTAGAISFVLVWMGMLITAAVLIDQFVRNRCVKPKYPELFEKG